MGGIVVVKPGKGVVGRIPVLTGNEPSGSQDNQRFQEARGQQSESTSQHAPDSQGRRREDRGR